MAELRVKSRVRYIIPSQRESFVRGTILAFVDPWWLVEWDEGPPWRGHYAADALEVLEEEAPDA